MDGTLDADGVWYCSVSHRQLLHYEGLPKAEQ